MSPFSRAQYNDTPLHYAATWGHYDTVSVLLKGGADPNACDNVRARWRWGAQCLSRAHTMSRRAQDGETPLQAAMREKHNVVASLLIKYNAV